MGFVFVKLAVGEIVSSSGGMVFRKLTTLSDRGKINLSTLGLPPGTYAITATSVFAGLESEPSNTVTYTVK